MMQAKPATAQAVVPQQDFWTCSSIKTAPFVRHGDPVLSWRRRSTTGLCPSQLQKTLGSYASTASRAGRTGIVVIFQMAADLSPLFDTLVAQLTKNSGVQPGKIDPIRPVAA